MALAPLSVGCGACPSPGLVLQAWGSLKDPGSWRLWRASAQASRAARHWFRGQEQSPMENGSCGRREHMSTPQATPEAQGPAWGRSSKLSHPPWSLQCLPSPFRSGSDTAKQAPSENAAAHWGTRHTGNQAHSSMPPQPRSAHPDRADPAHASRSSPCC